LIVAGGGGVLNLADGVAWGGPVANQGIWFRGDGLSVAGFLPHVPITIKGWHAGVFTQFAYQAAARVIGGATAGQGRLLPFLWAVQTSFPFVPTDIMPNNNGVANTPFRIGWDYQRKPNGSINWANVTSWARSSGQATVTVALGNSIAITAASRTGGNIVTLTFANATMPLPISRGDQQWIHVTSSDSNFPSGDKQLFQTNGVNTIAYVESGSNVTGGAIGTWESHGICARDRIEVLSTDSEVPSTMYKVTGVTDATHFVVTDPNGFSPRTATITRTSPGQYVLQDRFNYTCSVTTQYNNQASSIANSSIDTFEAGPTFDYGGSSDARNVLERSSMGGGHALNNTSTHFADLDRAACILLDGGASGSPALVGRDLRPFAGAIRAYPSQVGTSTFDFQRVIPDINIVVAAPPVVEIVNGTQAYQMWCDNCFNTDNIDPTVPNIKADLALYSKVTLKDCGLVQIGQGGAMILGTSGSINGDWAGATALPVATELYGFGPGGRVSGITSSTYRNIGGVFSPRFQNLLSDDPTAWPNGIGATVTAGQADPHGGTSAVKVDGTGLFRMASYSTTGNAVGDRWIVCAQVRKSGGFDVTDGSHEIFHVNQVNDNGPWNLVASIPYSGDGDWQPVFAMFKLANAGTANDNTFCYLNVVSTVTVYKPTLIRIPNSVGMSDSEAFDYLTTLRGHPAFLAPGQSGTDIGRKFIAHGGLGTAARYTVGVGSGQITLGAANTKAVELFDESGSSLGVVAMSSFTVNP
jgi:hypothetical protein